MITSVRPTSYLQTTNLHFACHHQRLVACKIIILFLSSLMAFIFKAIVRQDLCRPTLCLPSPTSDCLQNNHFLFIVFMITSFRPTSSVQPKQKLTIVVIAIFTKDRFVSCANHLQNHQNIQCIVLQNVFHYHRLSSHYQLWSVITKTVLS